MAVGKSVVSNNQPNKDDDHSLKGALFSSIVFVGGTIVLFIGLLLVLYMVHI